MLLHGGVKGKSRMVVNSACNPLRLSPLLHLINVTL